VRKRERTRDARAIESDNTRLTRLDDEEAGEKEETKRRRKRAATEQTHGFVISISLPEGGYDTCPSLSLIP